MKAYLESADRYWHTLRHLRRGQIVGRLRYRIARPKPDLRPAPPRKPATRDGWVDPVRRQQSQISSDRFQLLNEEHSLASHGWDDPSVAKLLRYNLHYFDDLNAKDAVYRDAWHRVVLDRWIRENPPGKGTGWEPYPTSLRIVNWVKWILAGNPVCDDILHSLAVQARWLTRRLEHHLLGNHLLSNAKALIFAGVFFDGEEANVWLETGLAILHEQLREQVLADGGHFELSPMYHALVLEDLLDLINLSLAYPQVFEGSRRFHIEGWRDRIDPMMRWLQTMCHPDGEIAFFNDAAIGVAAAPVFLESYAERVGCGAIVPASDDLTHLVESGYIRIASEPMVVLLDVARVGPDYLPGHAHADTLSFELSIGMQRILVNTGISAYGLGDERQRQRGTAAHNTVIIDGRNSSDVWAGFRVAHRAYPTSLRVSKAESYCVTCGHDGYARLPSKPIHARQWLVSSDGIAVADCVEGHHARAMARFHFHPDVKVSLVGNGGSVANSETDLLRWRVETGHQRLEPSMFHPEFGLAIASKCLVVDLIDGNSRIDFKIAAESQPSATTQFKGMV